MELVCFTHLPWDFVYQRPQHLLSRFAKQYRVYYFEEPRDTEEDDHFAAGITKENIAVVKLFLAKKEGDRNARLTHLVHNAFKYLGIQDYICWYYTPMALQFTRTLTPRSVVYDCMDELSQFRFAPAELLSLEEELMEKADVVFTGGHRLYEAKKHRHPNIHPFPSSIDFDHFAQARSEQAAEVDDGQIGFPRLGFFGVVDERFDVDLLRNMAASRPDWHFVIIGPVVKIDPAILPQAENIHYLGQRSYDELPQYINSWDIALMPFAINESTEFISPTKTPEYLAAGKPVISTAIHDVVRPYGTEGLVHIADTAEEFIACAEKEMAKSDRSEWLTKVDSFLAGNSWDRTTDQMSAIISDAVTSKKMLANV
ncbi:MAG: glycosyltransferase family 1 protein [Chryseobacterium sp.]|nr:MAG: glycosyltransferase family 1 protein [Chryseobacterium sp.]